MPWSWREKTPLTFETLMVGGRPRLSLGVPSALGVQQPDMECTVRIAADVLRVVFKRPLKDMGPSTIILSPEASSDANDPLLTFVDDNRRAELALLAPEISALEEGNFAEASNYIIEGFVIMEAAARNPAQSLPELTAWAKGATLQAIRQQLNRI